MITGEKVLSTEHLSAVQESMALIHQLQLQLGLVKRGFNDLWREISPQYGLTGPVKINYNNGTLTPVDVGGSVDV